MNRKQALEDLFLAVKRYLVKRGRSQQVSIIVADKVTAKAKDASIEDIRALRNVFLA